MCCRQAVYLPSIINVLIIQVPMANAVADLITSPKSSRRQALSLNELCRILCPMRECESRKSNGQIECCWEQPALPTFMLSASRQAIVHCMSSNSAADTVDLLRASMSSIGRISTYSAICIDGSYGRLAESRMLQSLHCSIPRGRRRIVCHPAACEVESAKEHVCSAGEVDMLVCGCTVDVLASIA